MSESLNERVKLRLKRKELTFVWVILQRNFCQLVLISAIQTIPKKTKKKVCYFYSGAYSVSWSVGRRNCIINILCSKRQQMGQYVAYIFYVPKKKQMVILYYALLYFFLRYQHFRFSVDVI